MKLAPRLARLPIDPQVLVSRRLAARCRLCEGVVWSVINTFFETAFYFFIFCGVLPKVEGTDLFKNTCGGAPTLDHLL